MNGFYKVYVGLIMAFIMVSWDFIIVFSWRYSGLIMDLYWFHEGTYKGPMVIHNKQAMIFIDSTNQAE